VKLQSQIADWATSVAPTPNGQLEELPSPPSSFGLGVPGRPDVIN
jgi:hypothetical protein